MEPDAFEENQVEPLEFSVRDNKVLVRQHAAARGAGSGIELDMEIWAVWTLNDDGLVTRLESYLPHQEATPSKPPDFRSRRCRGRTRRWLAENCAVSRIGSAQPHRGGCWP
jgi:hypothetical protein